MNSMEEENGRKEINEKREENGEEEDSKEMNLEEDDEVNQEDNNLLFKEWSQFKKSHMKEMISRAQARQIKIRKIRHYLMKFVDFQMLRSVDVLLKIFIDKSQVGDQSLSRLHFIILILSRIKSDTKTLRRLVGITNQRKRISQIGQSIIAVKQSLKILKTTVMLSQNKQSKVSYNKDNLNDNADIRTRMTTNVANELHEVQRILSHLESAIKILKNHTINFKFSRENSTNFQNQQQQPQPTSSPIQPVVNQIPENNQNNPHQIPRDHSNIQNSNNPAVVYQVSLDLQVYQYIVKIIKSTMNHFDILCKVLIILSLTFMILSIHSILNDFQSSNKNIFSTSDDIFLTSLEWLSMNKNSREIVGNFTLFVIFSSVLAWRKLWENIVCEFTDEDSVLVKKNAFRFCMPKQLVLMKIMDSNMLSDHLEALIMCWQICLSDLSRIASMLIAETINTLQDQDFAVSLVKLQKMRVFNRLLMAVNFLNLFFFTVIFSSIGPALLFRLAYGNIAALLWNIRIEIVVQIISSSKGQLYYASINLDSISKPTVNFEILFSFVHEILKLLQFGILICFCIANPPEVGFSVLLIYYFTFGVTSTVSKLRLAWTNYRRLTFFEKNVDVFFPRKIITEQNKDEICSICHDSLEISRSLKDCPHSFHLKCIYQWIQTQQQQPRCPICRVPIANASQLNNVSPVQNMRNLFTGNSVAQAQGAAGEQDINNYNNNNNNNQDENELLQQELDHIPAELYVQPLVNL